MVRDSQTARGEEVIGVSTMSPGSVSVIADFPCSEACGNSTRIPGMSLERACSGSGLECTSRINQGAAHAVSVCSTVFIRHGPECRCSVRGELACARNHRVSKHKAVVEEKGR